MLKGYPRLSETFIAQELLGLEQRGLRLQLYSLRRPTDPTVHPIHREICAPVDYLPEYLHEAPGMLLRAWVRVRRRPGYPAARKAWLRDLRRDPTRNRVRRFGQALILADRLDPQTRRIYAHFLHTPASVARYAALITGLPWSCSAHAKDIWTSPAWEKREKLAEMDWLVTCTAAGRDHLQALAPPAAEGAAAKGVAAGRAKVSLVYHGLDFERFPAPSDWPSTRDGSDAGAPVVLLSVGRAVEKKGYDVLLRALAALPPELAWRFQHIGGGADLARLKALSGQLGLDERIDWLDAQPQSEVLAAYRRADLFVLASRVAADGDRDGLPNVLMEAQSQGLACLATEVSGIPELIHGDRTGVMVPPDDSAALSAALGRLIGEPALRHRLGQAALQRVHGAFDMAAGLDDLAARFSTPDLTRAAE